MGIKGLWQALREYVDDGHLSQFRGQRVAVDMYVWLHRCIHRCVRVNTDTVVAYFDAKYSSSSASFDHHHDLLESSLPQFTVKREPLDGAAGRNSALADTTPDHQALPSIDDVLVVDDQFISLVLEKVAALQRFGVTPVCVFDGHEMPMKGTTDEERQRRRQDAFAEAMARLERLYCEVRRRLVATSGSHSGVNNDNSCDTQTMSAASDKDYNGWSHRRSLHVTLPHTSRLYEEAVQQLEKAVDISTELAHAVIQILKEERNVECIVAPYEADAQLAYLCREGYVAAAVSEDSDLIAYYCPCIISKLDTFSGKCEVLQPALCAPQFFQSVVAATAAPTTMSMMSSSHSASTARGALLGGGGNFSGGNGSGVHARLRAAAAQQPLHHSPHSPLSGCSCEGGAGDAGKAATAAAAAATTTTFTYESFLLGCIMAGCDYVPNLRNIGIKKAFKLVAHATSLRQVFALLETEYGFPAEELSRYRRRLLEAFYCFAHHLVYCPLRQEIVTFHSLPASAEGGAAVLLKTHLVGAKWKKETAQDVCARCLCDPCTLRLYRGVYQACLTRYLQRTRRGQRSLKAYAGFEELSSNKVVVHLSSSSGGSSSGNNNSGSRQSFAGAVGLAGLKRGRADEPASVKSDADGEKDGFGAPLQKKREASGFIGAMGAGGEMNHAGSGEPMVVVRSRYFLTRGRTAVCERWSASEDADDDDDDDNNRSDENRGTTGGKGEGVASRAAEAEQGVARTPGMSDAFFSLHAAPPRTATHQLLGLARPPRRASPSSPSSISATKAASGLTDDSTSAVEAATARSVQIQATDADGSSPNLGKGRSAECSSASDNVKQASEYGSTTATSNDVDSEPGDCFREEENSFSDHEGATAAKTCLNHLDSSPTTREKQISFTDTPDVEPYAYSIGGDAHENAVPLTEAKAASAVAAMQVCACPFGYWQCNRAHSVFESCFLGKQWNRNNGPPTPASPASASASPAPVTEQPRPLAASPGTTELSGGCAALVSPGSSADRRGGGGDDTRVGGSHRYTPRGFRPPRSTAFPSTAADTAPATTATTAAGRGASPSPCLAPPTLAGASTDAVTTAPRESAAVLLQAREINQGTADGEEAHKPARDMAASPQAPPMPSHRAAVRMAIFDKMTFKKT